MDVRQKFTVVDEQDSFGYYHILNTDTDRYEEAAFEDNRDAVEYAWFLNRQASWTLLGEEER